MSTSDIRGSTGGLPHQTQRRYFYQGDNTHAEGLACLLYEWSTSDLDWIKVTGTSLGAVNTSAVGGGGGTSVTVTSGSITVTNTGFQVTNAPSVSVTSGTVNLSGGTVGASISNAPSVTVTSGSITVTQASFGLTGGNVGASISNAPSVTVTSGSITVTQANLARSISGGIVGASISNAPSVTVTSGSITVTQASFGLTGGNVGASISNAPSVTVTSGSITLTNATVGTSVSSGSIAVTSGSISGGSIAVTSGSVTVTNTSFGQGVGGATTPWTTNLVSVGSTAVAATAKGTQGANGIPTQDLKDAGRTRIHLYVDRTVGVTAEAMATLSITKAGASQATSVAYVVTSGKTFRVQEIGGAVITNTTTALNTRMRLRSATSGQLTSVSASEAILEIGVPAAVANVTATEDRTFPDGVEFAALTSVGVSHVETAVTGSISFSVVGYEY